VVSLGGLVLLAGVLVYLYLPLLRGLVHQWRTDPNYSHGFLVPVVSAYLVWERRDALARAVRRPSAWGYLVLVTGLAMLVAGELAAFGYPGRLSLPVVLAGLVLLLGGPALLRVLAFPLAYLLFMLPLPVPLFTAIAFPLQLLAASVASAVLDLAGVPVFREGNIIHLAYTRLEVVEACSGIRSLISLGALAVVFAYFTQRGWWRQAVVVLSAIPIALATNALRIAVTGVLAHRIGLAAAMGFYHTFSGWLIFVLALGVLVTEGWWLARTGRSATAP
jgi:exosortase